MGWRREGYPEAGGRTVLLGPVSPAQLRANLAAIALDPAEPAGLADLADLADLAEDPRRYWSARAALPWS